MSNADNEKLKINIKSIKINRDFITELTNIFEAELSKIPSDEIGRLSYLIYYEDGGESEPKTTEKFKNAIQDKRVNGFKIDLSSRHKGITFWIIGGIRECKITTTDYDDDNWGRGVKSKFSDLVDDYKTVGGALSDSIVIIFSLLLSIVTAFLFILTYSPITHKVIDESIIFLGVIIGGNTILGFHYLLNWLFPKIETEYMKRVKYRKQILGGMVTLLILPVLRDIIFSFLLR